MIKNIIEYAAMIYGAMEIAYGITSRIRSGNVSKNNKDKGSYALNLLFFGIGFTISLRIYLGGSGGLMFADAVYPFAAGAAIVIIGFIVRAAAILTLNRQFTFSVQIFDSHRLYDSGIYRYIRHPSYLGIILITTGFGLAMNSWICLGIQVLINFIPMIYRINVEEKALIEKFGASYSDYMKKTKRLVPFIY